MGYITRVVGCFRDYIHIYIYLHIIYICIYQLIPLTTNLLTVSGLQHLHQHRCGAGWCGAASAGSGPRSGAGSSASGRRRGWNGGTEREIYGLLLKPWPIEIVDLPIEKWWFSIVMLVYQRVLYTWRFPKIGVPLVIIQKLMGFAIINHGCLGIPYLGKPPYPI